MANMKKILGILLALCFVLSVTAASAAASGNHDVVDHNKKHDDRNDKKFDNHRDGKKFNDKKDRHDNRGKWNRGKWIAGHYEKKVVKTVVYKHHQKIVIKKVIKVWVPGHWVQIHHR